jgi:hypothetical protein
MFVFLTNVLLYLLRTKRKFFHGLTLAIMPKAPQNK